MYSHSDPFDHFKVITNISLRTIFSSKNWLFYLILSFVPLLFTIPVHDKLLGADNAVEAFLGIMFTVQLTIFFTFGCLFISLPISSDEMSDHVIDLFVTRPIRRELLYVSKWLSLIFSLVIVNFLIIMVYFIYFILVDSKTTFIAGIFNNIDVLIKVVIFILLESLIYGSLFLVIGFIGTRGFSLGIFVAFFEIFISRMLFLETDPNMPRPNLQAIGEYLFSDYISKPTSGLPSVGYSIMYVTVVTILLVLLGIFYMRRKEFK